MRRKVEIEFATDFDRLRRRRSGNAHMNPGRGNLDLRVTPTHSMLREDRATDIPAADENEEIGLDQIGSPPEPALAKIHRGNGQRS